MQPIDARRWYLAHDRQKVGPFTATELRRMVEAGVLQHFDMSLEVGQTKWKEAGTIEGIWPDAIPLRPHQPNGIRCPTCKSALVYDSRLQGQPVRCPHCSSTFTMQATPASISTGAGTREGKSRPSQLVRRERRIWWSRTTLIGALAAVLAAVILVAGIGTFAHTPGSSPNTGEKQLAQAGDTPEGKPDSLDQSEHRSAGKKPLATPKAADNQPPPKEAGDRPRREAEQKKERLPSEKKDGHEVRAPKPRNQRDQRKQAMAKAVAAFEQQARRDIAEITQAVLNYNKESSAFEARRLALRERPVDEITVLLIAGLKDKAAELEKDLQRINRLMEAKRTNFEKRREALFREYPDAILPPWLSYAKTLEKSTGLKFENDGTKPGTAKAPKRDRKAALAALSRSSKDQLNSITKEIANLNRLLKRLDNLLAAKIVRALPPDELALLQKELEKRRAEAKKKEKPGQLPYLIAVEDIFVGKRNDWQKERVKTFELLRATEKKLVDTKQPERRIMVESPEPGDPVFVERGGLLYTRDELFQDSFGTPFRSGALGQVTGTVVEMRGNTIVIRYSLIVGRRAPGRLYRDPRDIRVRVFNEAFTWSDATDVRIQTERLTAGKPKGAEKKNAKPDMSNQRTGFPTLAEIVAAQKKGISIDPKKLIPGGENPGGFPVADLGRGRAAVDGRGNPVFTEEMIKTYRQETIKSVKKGQEVSVFYGNDRHAVVIVILRN